MIVTAMGATTGIFGRTEVAVMVAVVLLTTLRTQIALRGAFHLKSRQDVEEGLEVIDSDRDSASSREIHLAADAVESDAVDSPPQGPNLRVAVTAD